MPSTTGELTDDEFKHIVGALHALWGGAKKPCPACGHTHYFIHPALLANRSDTLSPLSEHTRLPTVAVYCKKCGYLEQYLAKYLGIEVLTVTDSSDD